MTESDQLIIERNRLNQRIREISGTPLARELSLYRKIINKPDMMAARGMAGQVLVIRGPRPVRKHAFTEATDTVELMHKWLDERNVPTHH